MRAADSVYSTENFMKKNKSPKAAEIASAKGMRDMFARLLFLSVKHHLDLSKIFEYPLIPEAACFAHPEGTIRSCEKAAIFPLMCVGVTTVPPSHTNTVVVNGMFFLRPSTYLWCFSKNSFNKTVEIDSVSSRYMLRCL